WLFFASRRRHTSWPRDWSSDVCSSDLKGSVQKASYDQHVAPTLFFILFGLSHVLIIAGFLHTTFGSSRIGDRSGEILSCRGILRSEERRVGREWRSRLAPVHDVGTGKG